MNHSTTSSRGQGLRGFVDVKVSSAERERRRQLHRCCTTSIAFSHPVFVMICMSPTLPTFYKKMKTRTPLVFFTALFVAHLESDDDNAATRRCFPPLSRPRHRLSHHRVKAKVERERAQSWEGSLSLSLLSPFLIEKQKDADFRRWQGRLRRPSRQGGARSGGISRATPETNHHRRRRVSSSAVARCFHERRGRGTGLRAVP